MKKYIFSLVCLCCALLPALEGQAHEYPNHPELRKSDANIVGHILDKNTKEHLPYITVALKGTTIGTVTDATGHYFLKNLPEGNFVLEVSSVGYKTVRRNVTLKKGRTLEEDFEIEEDAVALDGVVVSANRNETTRRLAPTLVNVVDLKIFENTNSTTLAQGLSFQPGVRVESNCQNCGFQQVRINGLDGPYTQILLDSRPIFSALSGVYGIEQIPASMIERVEVMRGGGSALFGSSAIAGTINIITKEPMRNSGMLSHTITGIADAMIDSTPVVVIAGQVATGFLGTDAFQEVDLVGITQPITKWSYQIRRAEDVAWAVARAFYIARSGRPGPVVLDFAKNAQVDKTEYTPVEVDYVRSYLPVPEMEPDAIQQAAELINAAERPLVLVGQGVELGNAQNELRAFIEKADIPAGCTLLGLSALPTAHPLNKGMLGMHGNLGPNINTNKCDVLIAVGMRFDDRVTGKLATYASQAKIIHFDIDPAEIDKNVKTDVAVLGNCKETLAAVTELLKPAGHKEWLDSFLPYEQMEEEKVIRPELHPAGDKLSMGEVVRAVSEATDNEAVLVTDVGQNQMMSARYFKYSKERSIVTSGGLGTMGFGLPAAIGATFGRPDRTVCVFMGDGGLQMNLQELGTVMEQKAPVKMILLNNNFLGNVRQWQAMFFNRRYSFTPMMNPDYMKIASAYEIPARRVFTREELAKAIGEMIATDGPFLLEACVEEEGNVMPMTPPGGSVNQMLLEC